MFGEFAKPKLRKLALGMDGIDKNVNYPIFSRISLVMKINHSIIAASPHGHIYPGSYI